MSFSWAEAGHEDHDVLDVSNTGPPDLAAVRRWVEARLSTLDEEHRMDVVLVVTELLDNAYLHGGGAHQLRLRRTQSPCEVTVAVIDAGGGRPRIRVPDDDGGRGLRLVDRLCRAWGVDWHDEGKVVWGRVGRP